MLNIKSPEVDALARKVAKLTGESITEAIKVALQDRLQKLSGKRKAKNLIEELTEISDRCSKLPVLDDRTPDEILGYDDDGLPS